MNEIFNQITGTDIKIIYDNSGFSYRDEKEENIFNFHEFKRIEIVFLGTEVLVREKFLYIQNYILNLTKHLDPILLGRPEESYGGKEEVTDIVLKVDSKEVEIFGSHIHFRTFLDGLKIESNPMYITACCGISLSRITLASIYAEKSKG